MVTGIGGSNETVGPTLNAKRRRRKEQLEEDDSSELSEESDDDGEQNTLGQIKFNKMPLRSRAGSSPLRNQQEGPSVLVTSPSLRPGDGPLRRGSMDAPSATRPFRGRARRDTTTSSEMSSENELDATYFQRKQVKPRRAAKTGHLLAERIQEDDRENDLDIGPVGAREPSEGSLSSDFGESEDSASDLGDPEDPLASLPLPMPGVPQISTPQSMSPKKPRPIPITQTSLQALPPPRPISVIAPVSLLSKALKAKDKKPVSPFERFATLSGKGDPNPLYIRIYSGKPMKPIELLLRRNPNEGGAVTVAEVIGFALWRYNEEKLQPTVTGPKANVNKWNFRMVEDEEVDYDFPALARSKLITDFTSNNNRGARGRSREKPWDEFALVEASETEFSQNEKTTPQYSKEAADAMDGAALTPQLTPSQPVTPTPAPTAPADLLELKPPPLPITAQDRPRIMRNPITGPSFASAVGSKEAVPLDAPAVPVSHAAPKTGLLKLLNVHFLDDNFLTRSTQIEVTTDTYIADVFDQVCKRLNVDKAMYVLKVHATTTVAPSDRTVEALGDRSDLDLAKRRFIGDGTFGLSGSPGSSSPNAPLLVPSGGVTPGTPKKTKKGTMAQTPALTARQENVFTNLSLQGSSLINTTYKRYTVIRKQPMSFSTSASTRVIAIDAEYLHILPASALSLDGTHHNRSALIDAMQNVKISTIHFGSIVGSKVSRRHARMFSFGVFREKGETKRYDFEAPTQAEAVEIVGEIRRGIEKYSQDAGL